MTAGEATVETRRSSRALFFVAALVVVLALLFGVPWWTLVAAPGWSTPVEVLGSVVFVVALAAFPGLMFLGHGRGRDWAARAGDVLLGVIWVLFTWSVLGTLLRGALALGGIDGQTGARAAAGSVAAVSVLLLLYGYAEAMRVPRVRRVEVTIPRLGAGFDGARVVLITDTHYGPINRTRWSAKVTETVNTLEPDVVCHTGDIADGTAEARREQSEPLGRVRAALARTYVTGNHEYYSEAQGWVERMRELGWEALRNRHVVVERSGDRLVIAGVDDVTAAGSGLPGHGEDLGAALTGADPALPVLLLAHQPKQIRHAVEHGVDLQLSGHTHGGQIWPFHYLVRVDQPAVAGLSRHGERTQLYTSRGTGFWGPPFRVFAPSEITLLTLRSGN
ncbi:MAG: metallophosphoesterase [Hamadaea sp.]|uniref:metallophosphoesterase n=1 Tax=Hamadaea sp. TaxID=2024425 RepID=UPI0017D2E0F6|nr:metallophosphoesterase [Hamadaea sp.]NUR71242.1 metallophosphoesterase [Hamadaea sp.]NUT19643.1 metallophosphoesterase [Hamadaea sp.]